jgi:CPA2 family monovalent cation:H+ antiporter-2
MMHLPALIQDLGFILITATVVTLLCRWLKQPVVLGYLIAGFLVGPHVPFIHTVTDIKGVQVWAEIGVIFLLFSLGLEFSFKKLSKVGGSAGITALFEISCMLMIGFFTGRILGWEMMDCLFLGGILSISSTSIIVRALDELNLKAKSFVPLVFGVLVVEDLLAVLLLMVLSTLAATATFSGEDILISVFKLGFFLSLWFLVGIYLLPVILKKIKGMLNNETILIVSIGLCLMMVMIATKVGFSPALGAFVMGSLLAETSEGQRIEKVLHPVRDLFAAVFFVSVGMLINPPLLLEHSGAIVVITLAVLLGKIISVSLGALVSGQSLKNSVQAGFSLAQIGEFSFIIATLGLTLKVTSEFLYPIAVAVSAITSFTTPYQIRYSQRIARWLESRLGQPVIQRLNRYQNTISRSSGRGLLKLAWDEYGMKIILNTVMTIAVTMAMTRMVIPAIVTKLPYVTYGVVVFLGAILNFIVAGPFLWAVMTGAPAHISEYDNHVINQLKRLQIGLFLVRVIMGFMLVSFIVGQYAPLETTTGIILTVLALGIVFFNKYAEPLYRTIEKRFVNNLNDSAIDDLVKTSVRPELSPWQATMTEFTVTPESPLVAKPLSESQLKERFGLTIAMIQRGERQILAPRREELILPYDKLFLIGDEEQLAGAQAIIETKTKLTSHNSEVYGLNSLLILDHSPFVNKSIRECGIRHELNALIVGIEREGRRILSPDASIVLQTGDLLWIVGDKQKIAQARKLPAGA